MGVVSNLFAMEHWCTTNIAMTSFYIPIARGMMRGGTGWSITFTTAPVMYVIDITDEQKLVLFLLLFGHTGIRVRRAI